MRTSTILAITACLVAIGGKIVQSQARERAGSDGRARADAGWWSLQPVVRPQLPTRVATAQSADPIDLFVRRESAKHGLAAARPADPVTLLRRASFDLTGLPPSPQELDELLADQSLEAFSKLVDRLLASPHYGERWGRHWLDVVRFGESDGFENDKLRDHAWRYRDYVIDSFNRDVPYDQFAREQLAGDTSSLVTRNAIAATGFLVAGPWDEIQFVAKSPTERKRAREEQQEELLATIGQTFLGLTIHCARCHDHKFDPITQSDYYGLKAVFDGIDHRSGDPQVDAADRGNKSIFSAAERQAYESEIAPIRQRIQQFKSTLTELANRIGSDARVEASDQSAALRPGKFGEALSGLTGYAEAPAKPSMLASPLTVECWAELNNKTPFNILVACQPKESADHWELYTYAGTGEFSVYMPGYEPSEIKSGADITDGAWHHVAMTFDQNRIQLFVDGRRMREVMLKRLRNGGPAGPLWFGAYPPQKIGCHGSVDEVRISNVVRPIAELPDGPFQRDSATIGLWHFDQIDGGQIDDASSAIDPSARDANHAEADSVRAQITSAERELAEHSIPLAYVGVRRQPEPTVLYLRGDIQKPAGQVAPASPSAVHSATVSDLRLTIDLPDAERRARFANWVTSAGNPLFARVMVNRVWQYHFGQGLVETPSDFGFNGGKPSHAELLDWLASEFIASGYSVKALHKAMMCSATYRQSSEFDPRAAEIDADNRLLWRFTPRRLEAETARDAMLAVSGDLNRQIGGPSFRPFTTTALLTQFYHLIDDGRAEFNRRTVYRINVNTAKDPLLDSLDCPSPSVTAPKRRSTTTTLQSLALMNDTFVLRQSERFASRVREVAGDNSDQRMRAAFRIALGREPTAQDRIIIGSLQSDGDLEQLCWALLNSSEFLYVR